jgi:hypothetical protein
MSIYIEREMCVCACVTWEATDFKRVVILLLSPRTSLMNLSVIYNATCDCNAIVVRKSLIFIKLREDQKNAKIIR